MAVTYVTFNARVPLKAGETIGSVLKRLREPHTAWEKVIEEAGGELEVDSTRVMDRKAPTPPPTTPASPGPIDLAQHAELGTAVEEAAREPAAETEPAPGAEPQSLDEVHDEADTRPAQHRRR